MRKSTFHTIVDAAALAALVLLAATGALIHYVLPPGSGHFSTIWYLDRHEWGDIHFWIALTFLSLMVLHFFLHWPWIAHTIRGDRREGSRVRVALAAVATLVVAAIAASPFFAEVATQVDVPHKLRSGRALEHEGSPSAPTHESTKHDAKAPDIDGTMTLREVERRTGVSAAVVIEELGLPSDFPRDETLGRLRKKYGFEMQRLREIVQKHLDGK